MPDTSPVPPEFSPEEMAQLETLLVQRYGHLPDVQMADVELALDPESEQLTECPAVYWSERGAHFIVCKTAPRRYRTQFFYSEREQFGTGRDSYPDLEECITTVLRLQADDERERSIKRPPQGPDQTSGQDVPPVWIVE